MATVSKKMLVTEISKETGINQAEVRKIIGALFTDLKKHYQAGDKIELRGFGTFFPYHRKVRSYKDPVTQSEKQMKEKMILKFRSSHQLFI